MGVKKKDKSCYHKTLYKDFYLFVTVEFLRIESNRLRPEPPRSLKCKIS